MKRLIGPSATIASNIEATERRMPNTAIRSLLRSRAFAFASSCFRISSAASCSACRLSSSRFSRSIASLGMAAAMLSRTSRSDSIVERTSSLKCFAIPADSSILRPSLIAEDKRGQFGIADFNSSSVNKLSLNSRNSSRRNMTVASRASYKALRLCHSAANTCFSRSASSVSDDARRR